MEKIILIDLESNLSYLNVVYGLAVSYNETRFYDFVRTEKRSLERTRTNLNHQRNGQKLELYGGI